MRVSPSTSCSRRFNRRAPSRCGSQSGRLRAQIPSYVAELHLATRTHEFLDIGLAKKIADQCLNLLNDIDVDTPKETRQLIQAAIRYFLLDDDADSDKESLIGFDDDARVVELVAREIGREDLFG